MDPTHALEDLFPQPWPRPLGSQDRLYFLHLAKTAGRSFEAFLKLQFSAEEAIRIDVDKGYPEAIPEELLSGKRLFLGHLGYHFLSFFPQGTQPAWITMLREPVDRVISYYYFFRNMQPVGPGHISYRHQELASTLSLQAFVESPETAELVENYQFRDLLDSQMLLPDMEAVRRWSPRRMAEQVRLVKERLQNECVFFGLTERYESSTALLCYTFGWELPGQPPARINLTADKPKREQIPAAALEAIRRRVELDQEIYEFACGLFEQRLNEMHRRLLGGARPEDAPPAEAATPAASVRRSSQMSALYPRLRDRLHALVLGAGRGLGLVKPPALFDAEWYLAQYPDVARAGMHPYVHYRVWGWKYGRNPSPSFNVRSYLEARPELRASGREPLAHAMQEARQRTERARRRIEVAGAPPARGPAAAPDLNRLHGETRLCFHFPASPNAAFYSQIAMFRRSLDSLGGIYQRADISIMFGDEQVQDIPERWRAHLGSGLRTGWVSPEVFRRHRYDAQGDAQWGSDYEGYDLVCIADADVMLLKPIDDLLTDVLERPALTGAIAHIPFPSHPGRTPRQEWNDLAQRFIQKPLRFDYRYSMVEGQPPDYTVCPFYINFGFIVMPRAIMQAIGPLHRELRPLLAEALAEPFYAAQASLALTAAACEIPCRAVGLRYNFPNDARADELQRNELSDVRVIHYLRTDRFDRQKIFTSEAEFEGFLALDLGGSNRLLQEHVQRLTGGRYPF